jgi:transcriptional regulator with GAF, ATPase, and Fis domain
LLTRTFVQLADTLVDDFDVVDLLTTLARRCAEVLDISAAGLMLATPDGDLRVVASSSEAMRLVELFEVQSQEGPCFDCFRTHLPVLNHHLGGTLHRWPRFEEFALNAGFHSVHALPMRLRSEVIGALNLFCTDQHHLEEGDAVAGQALADVATISILHHRAVLESQVVNAQLMHALESRIVIEQAKGALSERTGLDLGAAFSRMRNHARRHNLKLADVARGVIDGSVSIEELDRSRRIP